jgi:hypothetical protein
MRFGLPQKNLPSPYYPIVVGFHLRPNTFVTLRQAAGTRVSVSPYPVAAGKSV